MWGDGKKIKVIVMKKNNQITQMSPLDIAKAGEASDEFLRYLAEQEM